MHEWRADLHMHSTCSDGTVSPSALVAMAKESGLQALSITDHDTISAYPVAFQAAKEHDIKIISGVELSCVHEGETIHILGYAFDVRSEVMIEQTRLQKENRLLRNRLILEKLAKHNVHLDESDIAASFNPNDAYGRVHIALAMVKKGYVSDVIDAFKHYIGNKQPCYVESSKWSVEEGIGIIHQAKGKAVLAHPHLISSSSICRKVLKMNFDGIEAYYSRRHWHDNEKWVRVAQEKGLFTTGGSDYHGEVKPDIRLGCSFTPQEVFLMLEDHFLGHTNAY